MSVALASNNTHQLPTLEELREWTGEMFMDLNPEQIAALFGPTTRADVALFRDVWPWGSRAGLVNCFAIVHDHKFWWEDTKDNPSPVIAHLCAEVWTEGKAHSALAEFQLEERDGIHADHLIEAMWRFRCSDVIMAAEELAAYDALPEVFTVWRGGAVNPDELRIGHSWTTDRRVAHKFAEKAAFWTGGVPKVVRRRARGSDVVAYFTRRNEQEAVLLPSARDLRHWWREERRRNAEAAEAA